MLQIENIKLSLDQGKVQLRQKAAKILGISPNDLGKLMILRRAIDARDSVHFVYTVQVSPKNEDKLLRRCRSHQVSRVSGERFVLPAPVKAPASRPVVVGAGPGGLFCALALARCGAAPILLEQGKPVELRQADVERFWQDGTLDTLSNVQFGEGGAGAFSDGKLNTGTKDLSHRFILETLVNCGAPESILWDAKPHVGTDYLHIALKNLREELIALGCDIRFGHRLTGLSIENGVLTGLRITGPQGEYLLPAEHAVLALGNSARDTFEMLSEAGVAMEPKPLAVGVRIEHLQADVDASQYKAMSGHPRLPASTYKLSCHLENGRSVFSFCVCPGGSVVAAASETDRAVTNGMSEYARDGENINGGLLVNVRPEDFPGRGPLAGITFQRELEERAFRAGGGNYRAPAQRVEDFLAHRPSQGPGRVKPTYRPDVQWCSLWDVLPDFVAESLEQALPILDKKIHGFADGDAVLTAVETRSSCPLRILRGEDGEADIRGLWPCGEGAGYAGGIMSAAADGLKTACHILERL